MLPKHDGDVPPPVDLPQPDLPARNDICNPWRIGAVTAAFLTIVLGTAAAARAGVPSDQLRAQIDGVVRVLGDTELRKSARAAERRAAIRRIATETFDFTEMSRRALGPHWQARTTAERDDFTGLFADLLEQSYIGKVELYSGENVAFLGDTIDGDFATVRTKFLTTQQTEVPVVYRMIRRGDHWRV